MGLQVRFLSLTHDPDDSNRAKIRSITSLCLVEFWQLNDPLNKEMGLNVLGQMLTIWAHCIFRGFRSLPTTVLLRISRSSYVFLKKIRSSHAEEERSLMIALILLAKYCSLFCWPNSFVLIEDDKFLLLLQRKEISFVQKVELP